MFRAFSLILIILILSTGVFVLFGDALIEPFIRDSSNILEYAFTVDQLGNIFFIRKDRDSKNLIVLDSTGEEWMQTDITDYFGEHFFVDNIYILQNKNIWITGYEYETETLMIENVKIAAFREDGSYIEHIFDSAHTAFKDGIFRKTSSLDEDDRLVYFAGIGYMEGMIDVYAYPKDASEPVRKIGEYSPRLAPGAHIVAMHALPGGGLVISSSDGSLIMYGVSRAEEVLSEGAGWSGRRVDRFWNGAGVFYMHDAVSGTIFSSPTANLRPTAVINGTFVVSAETGAAFMDMHDISVSGVGNVLGVLRTDNGVELYLGGFTFLPRIATVRGSSHASITDWFVLISVIVGIIIVSILIWEFFVHFMRMRMPMVVRQTLLTALVVFIAFFILSEYSLIPRVGETLRRSYSERLNTSTEILLSSLVTGVPPGSSAAEYNLFMEQFGAEYNFVEHNTSPMFAYLFARGGEGITLAASSGRYPQGIMMSTFLPYPELMDAIYGVDAVEGQIVSLSTEIGEMIALIKPTDIMQGEAETVFCVIVNSSELDNSVRGFAVVVNNFLLVTGVLLSAMIILTTLFHVVTLKKLSGALHSFGLGRYDDVPVIRSGDETGEMYRHVSRLAEILKENDESLRALSRSYHRFVPERFLKLLGETRVEKVTKELQTRIEGAYVVFIRFGVSSEHESSIFENTNLVLENIVPIVGRYNGTVYNFLHNGFDGVFEGGALNAMDAVLSIRDACRKFNNLQAEKSGMKVDLRVVLTKGDLTLGFMGDETRMEPTAVSDAYTLADSMIRICFGSDIYVAASGELYDEIKGGDYYIRKIGKTTVGGAGKTIELFDIFDSDPASLFELKKSFADKFEVGVSLFGKGDYNKAYAMFMDIIKHSAEDGVTRNYLYLSEYNLRNADKQLYYTAFENESIQRYFSKLSDAYYSNAPTE